MVEKLQELLGVVVPVQFEPLFTLFACMFLILLIAYFAEMLKLIILRR